MIDRQLSYRWAAVGQTGDRGSDNGRKWPVSKFGTEAVSDGKLPLPPRSVAGQSIAVHTLSFAAPCTLATQLLSPRTSSAVGQKRSTSIACLTQWRGSGSPGTADANLVKTEPSRSLHFRQRTLARRALGRWPPQNQKDGFNFRGRLPEGSQRARSCRGRSGKGIAQQGIWQVIVVLLPTLGLDFTDAVIVNIASLHFRPS